MKRWFTADQHFGHVGVIRLCSRPFESTEEMTNAIVARHNMLVAAEDVVYHLGDFAWREQVIPAILKRLNGTHHLVAGNHDKCFSIHRKHAKALDRYRRYGFASIVERTTMAIGSETVLVCHLPYRLANDADQRFAALRPVDRGAWLLHGHVHTCWERRGRMLNVGVDVHGFAPVSEDEIVASMRRAA